MTNSQSIFNVLVAWSLTAIWFFNLDFISLFGHGAIIGSIIIIASLNLIALLQLINNN